ncbi:MAG: hypothetical protein ACRD1B_11790 [Thermoanaerobaculia bacterium]
MKRVRITTRDAPTMRAVVADLALDVSCGGPQSLKGGGATVNVQVEASAIDRLRRPGVKIEVLYDVETRTRKLAKQIGKGNRFLGKDRYPQGLGRPVKEGGDVVP